MMKAFKLSYFFFLAGLMVISCQKDSLEIVQEIAVPNQEFTVPDIPDEIASMMTNEDLARFQAGPGEGYLQRLELGNARRNHGRWYPVLMKLGYHLQIGPIVGASCEPGMFSPCFNENGPTGAPGCEDPVNYIGAAGATVADGYWFSKAVHSMYFPVFCGPDYTGYGSGFYQLENGLLWLEAENGPFHYDENGNSTFCREGQYVGDQSAGMFEGAFGWEVMISYTAADNNPGDPANGGVGYSDVIIFGWVHLAN